MAATSLYFSAHLIDDRAALTRGLRRRDPELLDRLIEQYQYRLFRYLLYLTSSPETAEDLFQETWIRVLDRGHQYDGQARFETWLFSIARHLVVDLHRRKRPESIDALTSDPQAGVEFAAGGLSPLELASQRELEADVQATLAKLPAVFREVLLLRFQEDLRLEEIAEVAGIPLSTVKSRLYRGLEELRRRLEKGAN
jgi:RNA polymerase sigma-70 factor (ECF subfamily)